MVLRGARGSRVSSPVEEARGHARILVNRGHLHQDALLTECISHEELLQALRENGCATLADCRLAVLEVDGSISVIPHKT